MASYKIKEHHGTYNRTKRTKTIEYIVIHYTGAGSAKKGNALANCKYFASCNRNASAHYFVDNGSICEYADPETYYTWHCGGGSGPVYNSNSIGIEVCQAGYDDNPYTAREIKRLTWLVQKLMDDYDIPASHIVRHYDVTGKLCPYYYARHEGKWTALRNKITGKAAETATDTTSSATATDTATSSKTSSAGASETSTIKDVQAWVGTTQDGIYGSQTQKAVVKKLQTALNKVCGASLTVDGIFGTKTKAAIPNVSSTSSKASGTNIVKALRAGLICDGYSLALGNKYNARTKAKVKKFQAAHGLTCDGIAGKITYYALFK